MTSGIVPIPIIFDGSLPGAHLSGLWAFVEGNAILHGKSVVLGCGYIDLADSITASYGFAIFHSVSANDLGSIQASRRFAANLF